MPTHSHQPHHAAWQCDTDNNIGPKLVVMNKNLYGMLDVMSVRHFIAQSLSLSPFFVWYDLNKL